MPVAISQPGSVFTVTVAGKFVPRPSGYGRTLVPLNRTKFGRAHAMALSSESAR